jgi:hypothetical protein
MVRHPRSYCWFSLHQVIGKFRNVWIIDPRIFVFLISILQRTFWESRVQIRPVTQFTRLVFLADCPKLPGECVWALKTNPSPSFPVLYCLMQAAKLMQWMFLRRKHIYTTTYRNSLFRTCPD